MKRSGGKAGRPFGDWSIQSLENHVSLNEYNLDELKMVRNELGFRSSARAGQLSDLVDRLIRNPEPRGLL